MKEHGTAMPLNIFVAPIALLKMLMIPRIFCEYSETKRWDPADR